MKCKTAFYKMCPTVSDLAMLIAMFIIWVLAVSIMLEVLLAPGLSKLFTLFIGFWIALFTFLLLWGVVLYEPQLNKKYRGWLEAKRS